LAGKSGEPERRGKRALSRDRERKVSSTLLRNVLLRRSRGLDVIEPGLEVRVRAGGAGTVAFLLPVELIPFPRILVVDFAVRFDANVPAGQNQSDCAIVISGFARATVFGFQRRLRLRSSLR
jgi:hypothetical protein